MSVEEARQDPRLGRYRLRSHKIDTARGPLKVVAPRSRDEVVQRSPDARRRAERGDLPHWASVWPASVGIARRLCRGPDRQGQWVWDLGCGLGVAGLGATRVGASVLFLDREEEALAFAGFQARGAEAEVRALRFDWSRDELPELPCDLLLLCDLSYEFRHTQALNSIIDTLHERGAEIWVVDPERPTGNDLFRSLRARGAIVEYDDVAFEGERIRHRIAVLPAPAGGPEPSTR